MTGTWYAVARLKGTGSYNDHVIRITKDDTSGLYIMHTTGTRFGGEYVLSRFIYVI